MMKKKTKKLLKANKGITLIALVVTIVVLLILAAVSISMLGGENGIITQAIEAKDKTEIGEEKEKVELAAVAAAGKDGWGEITEENLEEELDKNIGDGKYTLTKEGDNFVVTYNDSKRSYLVDPNGKVEQTEIQNPEEKPDVSEDPAFTRAYGVIEIEFLSGTSYNATTTPNEPKMTSDMKKVYWENGEEKVEGEASDFDASKWYSYTAQTGNTESGGTSKWANAKTSDGSYWVWIPRYAYRIVYFDTAEHREAYRADNTQTSGIVGYSDARGIVDKDGKTPSDLQEPVTSIAVGENKLRPHPAFEDGSLTGFTQGEWDSKLEGIWIAKYEMSQSSSKIKSIPGVKSYKNATIGTYYTAGYNYDRNKDSHLLKNSEWGVIVYLTDSKYGRNGTKIVENSDDDCCTGGISGATALTNPLQSTTGNEYGIFDISGCTFEYVASYIADSTQKYGNSFASTDNTTNNKRESTKYSTVYNWTDSNKEELDNYKININKIFGDAIVETSKTGYNIYDWEGNILFFPSLTNNIGCPFFGRGGSGTSVREPGRFVCKSYSGGSSYTSHECYDYIGFRICFVIM